MIFGYQLEDNGLSPLDMSLYTPGVVIINDMLRHGS
jgi:hypothetical protein